MADPSIPRHYVVVRTDMPLVQQMVQVAHACRMAGASYGVPNYAHLTLLAVADAETLERIWVKLDPNNAYCFFDHDLGPGGTALCTKALFGSRPAPLRKLPLWAPS